MLRRIRSIAKLMAEIGLGYALFAVGGLAIGLGVQMDLWPLAVLGIVMVLGGFLIIGL